jgi:hypothetical protein
MKRYLIAFLGLLFLLPTALAETGYKVESIAALAETSVSEAVRKSLVDKGLRVVDEKGKAVCELWLRKEIAVTKDEVPGASYGQIPEGTLVGVIHFPANVSDFRGQGIKAGYYTLRYGLILQDGNHLGVSPARDFVLICPVADDKDPAMQMKTEEVLKLSRAASGASHPSVWSIVAATSAAKDLPKIVRNEHEHVILEIPLGTNSGPLPIGLIVVGRTEG